MDKKSEDYSVISNKWIDETMAKYEEGMKIMREKKNIEEFHMIGERIFLLHCIKELQLIKFDDFFESFDIKK
jgi:hypothetical protein